jgi:hypothetical protein
VLYIFGGLSGTGKTELAIHPAPEHRRRVETRQTRIPGLRLPGWQDVVDREYEARSNEHIVIATAGQTPEESKKALEQMLEL